jgi:FtsP/CotA-like multicopper oxidase with cupredoxin domain
MTPPHSGTFIYHTHWHDMNQLTTGLYGALIVLDPGETYDPERDRSYVVGRAGADLFGSPLLVNGTRGGVPSDFKAGAKYRLRFINITPDDDEVEFKLMDGEKPARWRAIAKDGATLPSQRATACEAKQVFGAGETYDFEFIPERAGELKLVTSFVGQQVIFPFRVR